MRCLMILLLGPLFAVGLNVTAPHADAAVPLHRVNIQGHIDCRTTLPAHGTALVVCSGGWMRELQPCRSEDSLHCYWNAQVFGNGRGRSFIVFRAVHYVHEIWHPAWTDNNYCIHYGKVTDCLAGEYAVRGIR